jgi:hypothetical protein
MTLTHSNYLPTIKKKKHVIAWGGSAVKEMIKKTLSTTLARRQL